MARGPMSVYTASSMIRSTQILLLSPVQSPLLLRMDINAGLSRTDMRP